MNRISACVLMMLFNFSGTTWAVQKEHPRKSSFIYDWSAMGSGCKGRISENGGNASLSVFRPKPPFLDRLELHIKLNAFRLLSPVPSDQGPLNLEFARDCAIRAAINPPAGKRIADVQAITPFVLNKDDRAEMKVMSQLTLGMATLATEQTEFSRLLHFKNRRNDFRLASKSYDLKKANIKCGQAKLLGLDLLLYVKRYSELAEVNMSLDGDFVNIIIDLENCTSNEFQKT